MSRNSTIELLNETDALAYRMRWQLFVQENEQVVYGDYTGWQPGEPLHIHPNSITYANSPHLEALEDEFYDDGRPSNWGNHVRPMIQDIAIDVFHCPSHETRVYRGDPWCDLCKVSWGGEYGESCWSCGLRSYGPYLTELQRKTLANEVYKRRAAERQALIAARRKQEYDRWIACGGDWRNSHAYTIRRDMAPMGFDGDTQVALYASSMFGAGANPFADLFRVQSDDVFRGATSYFSWVDESVSWEIGLTTVSSDLMRLLYGGVTPYERPHIEAEDYFVKSDKYGSGAVRRWLDEWVGSVADTPVTGVETGHGISVEVPGKTTSWTASSVKYPAVVSTWRSLGNVVERHRAEYPHFYNQSDAVTHQRRPRSIR